MPKQGKRKESPISDCDENESVAESCYSPKKSRTTTRSGGDGEPQPGTSAQAIAEMRKEQADFQKKKKKTLEQNQKRTLPENDADKSGSKRPRRSDSTNNANNRKTTDEGVRQPKTCKEYLENRAKGLFDYEQASGIIKKISIYNFMCHSSFHKEWHPNLNFVTGQNGSGKSALLSAILIGLGARALATSRTKSISHLIQTGKDFAKTEITLLNSGGISEEKYGKEFMIERVLSQKGSSTYRIKCHGKFRQLLRAELDHILLNLDIQLDNPLMILNQETARSFLRSKDPKDKYRLFFDGTMMSKLSAVLNDCEENINIATTNINNFKDATKCVERQCDGLKESYKKIKEVEKIKYTVSKIYEEYLWSLVKEVEKKKENGELHLQAATDRVKEFEVKLEATVAKKTEIMEKPSDKEEEVAARSSLKVKETALSQIRPTYLKVRGQIAEAKSKLRGCDDHIEQRRERMEECKTTIEDMRKKAKEDEEKMNSEYSAKKDELDAQKAAVLQHLNTLKQDGEQFKKGADTVLQEVHEIRDQVNILNRHIERTQNNLTNLRKSTSNKFSVYGKDIEELIARVNANESKFKRKPVGPIGAYCTIKRHCICRFPLVHHPPPVVRISKISQSMRKEMNESKWVNLVESILPAVPTLFVVDNDEDSRLLRNLMNTVYGKYDGRRKQPTVFMSKFTPKAYDISSGRVRVPGIPTLLDLIDIEENNHIVFNVLCDFGKAERILLFDNKMAAINFIGNENRCPRTCISGYSLDFYQVTPNPNYAVWAMPNSNYQAQYLKASTKEQISSLRTALTNYKAELNAIKPTMEEKVREEAKLREEYNDRHSSYTQVRTKSVNIDIQIQQLIKKRNFQPDLTSQMEELAELTRKYNDRVTMKEAALKFLEENNSKLEEITAEKERLQADIAELTELITGFAEKAESRQGQLQKIENAMGRLTGVINKFKKIQEDEQKKLKTIEAELLRKLATAEETCSRVETDKEPEELENKFKTMKKTIAESAKILGTKEEIERKLSVSKKELFDRKEIQNAFLRLMKMVQSLLIVQQEAFQRTKSQIGDHLGVCFHAMATSRGYQGNLLVDHESKELYYFVCPDGNAHSKTQKVMASQDLKLMRKQLVEYSLGLSGGERSFATICFIISMWQVMSCPFFMLDEFDVFMDPFNRKTSQNALYSHAKMYKAHQFFFFTPLELTQIPEADDACVLRMFPPVRDDDDADEGRNVPPSPNESVGEVENTDPSDGSQSTRTNAKKARSAAGPAVMREKTNSRR